MGKEVDQPAPDAGAASAAALPPPLREQLASAVALIQKAVAAKDTRALSGRLLRQTASFRRRLHADDLAVFVAGALPASSSSTPILQQALRAAEGPKGMEMDAASAAASGTPEGQPLPEVELYAYLLVLTLLVDKKQFAAARTLAHAAVERLSQFNRRTLDPLAARIYFYLSLCHEQAGTLAEIRGLLLALHRTAVLRHDALGQETLLNLLLRNFLHYNLYDQAERLRAKAQRPEVSRSPQQACRYLLYLGRIRAVQLEYSEAKDCLQQAARKAPASAVGFRTAVHKWLVVVRLLLGEVPERSEFTVPRLRQLLQPYHELAQAVRGGDLHEFSAVASRHDATFRTDRTHNLIVRLRHNVIRAGLRRIALAYSRISLADVAAKLGLSSVTDTESIVSKAIRDGGIDAAIDHDAGVLSVARLADVYSTEEPAAAFHARVAFCMDIHNEALKAMRFEGSAAKAEWEDATKLRERQEQELAAALEEDDMDI